MKKKKIQKSESMRQQLYDGPHANSPARLHVAPEFPFMWPKMLQNFNWNSLFRENRESTTPSQISNL